MLSANGSSSNSAPIAMPLNRPWLSAWNSASGIRRAARAMIWLRRASFL